MTFLKKIINNFLLEIKSLFENLIIYYPDSKLGIKLRGWYFGNKFKKRGIKLNLMHGFRATFPEKITVGDKFSCNVFTYINCGKCNGIYFGNNVALGPNVYIRTANHRYDAKSKDVRDLGFQEIKIPFRGDFYSIVIEGNNWIGANCTILPGTFIEEGAIIGAGSIVSGKIKSNSIYLSKKAEFAFER